MQTFATAEKGKVILATAAKNFAFVVLQFDLCDFACRMSRDSSVTSMAKGLKPQLSCDAKINNNAFSGERVVESKVNDL